MDMVIRYLSHITSSLKVILITDEMKCRYAESQMCFSS